MADITKSIEIVFGAVDKTGDVISQLGSGVSKLASAAQDALSPLNEMADAVKKVDTAVVAVAVAFSGVAITKAGEFGQQVAEIGTLFGATNTQLGSLRSGVLSYAADSTQSIDKINAAIYSAVSAGVDWTKSIQFVTEAEKLSVAGKADLQAVVQVLTGTMNAYGATTQDTTKYSDLLFKTVQLGQTTLPAMATSLSQVTSTAAAAEIPFQDVAAAIVGLTTSGIPTEQAMTSLKAAIANIINPSKEASDAAKSMGIRFDANALASKGLAGVFKEVYAATGGNIEKMAQLFGSMEGLKAATALGADNSKLYAKALNEMKDAAGATAAAYDAMSNQFDNSNQKMKNSLDVFLITVGSKLGTEFASLVAGLGDIFKSLKISVDAGAFDSVFATVGAVGAKLSALFKEIAAALPAALAAVDFGKFNAAIETLAASVGGIFKGVDLTTPEGLAKAIQLVVDTIGTFLTVGAGIADAWAAAAKEAAPLVAAFASMSAETAIATGKTIGFADVLTILLGGLGSVGKGLEALGDGISLLAGAKVLSLVTSFEGLAETMLTGGSAITYVAGAILGTTGMVAAAGAGGYALGTVLNNGITAVVEKLTDSKGGLGGLLFDLTHNAEDLGLAVTPAAAGLKEMADAAGASSPLLEAAGTSMGGVAEEAKAAASAVDENLIKSMINAAVAAGDARAKTDFLAASMAALKKPTLENQEAMHAAAQTYKDAAARGGDVAEAAATIRKEYEKYGTATSGMQKELKNSADVMTELGKKTNLTNAELLKLAELTKNAEIELAKLASNEKIKNIEAKVTIDVAKIEAQTKMVQSAFESLDNTVNSTGDILSDLFGMFKDFDNLSWTAIDAIKDQIELENKRRQDALDLQKRLVQAQIDQMRAQTQALDKGEGLIKIDGANLQPHLEAFMWEIIKTVQVRVNQQGLAMLLGI